MVAGTLPLSNGQLQALQGQATHIVTGPSHDGRMLRPSVPLR
jgi:hypothetical protein